MPAISQTRMSEILKMVDAPVGVEWAMTPKDALEWFRLQSFTIAHVENQELLAYAQNAMDNALTQGVTFSDWLNTVNDLFDAYGVTRVSKHHLQTVFQTNIQSSFNAGRWSEYHDPDVTGFFPYFQYHAVDDNRTRYEHAIHNGAIYRRDDPFWNEWWPPNGYNCRCTVTAVSKYEVEDHGIQPGELWGFDEKGNWSKIGHAPRAGEFQPDEGFSGNPANGDWFRKWAGKKGVDLEEMEGLYGG